MKTKTTLLLIVFALVLTDTSNAQVNVLRRAINRQMEREIDTAINKKIQEDRARSEKEAREQKQTDQEPQGKPGGKGLGILAGNTDIKRNDEYQFTGRIYMQMETYDKKDVVKSDYFTYFNAGTSNAGIEVKIEDPEKSGTALPFSFIFDMDNRCFMMLMQGEGSKTGIISVIPDDSTLTAQSKPQKRPEEKQATITKTGNTKMIAGYKCDEFKVVEPGKDGYSNVWVTKDLRITADKSNWGKAGMPSYYNYPGFEDAVMLAVEGYDKSNKLEMKMETKEINENFKHSISTVGYTLLKVNFAQAGKK